MRDFHHSDLVQFWRIFLACENLLEKCLSKSQRYFEENFLTNFAFIERRKDVLLVNREPIIKVLLAPETADQLSGVQIMLFVMLFIHFLAFLLRF